MRDPDLVVRAQQAATALESAWCRWRNMHGLAADPAPAVSSYVGFSLDAPWGQPRIVFGICAEEAEQLATLLDRHDCVGPVHASVKAKPVGPTHDSRAQDDLVDRASDDGLPVEAMFSEGMAPSGMAHGARDELAQEQDVAVAAPAVAVPAPPVSAPLVPAPPVTQPSFVRVPAPAPASAGQQPLAASASSRAAVPPPAPPDPRPREAAAAALTSQVAPTRSGIGTPIALAASRAVEASMASRREAAASAQSAASAPAGPEGATEGGAPSDPASPGDPARAPAAPQPAAEPAPDPADLSGSAGLPGSAGAARPSDRAVLIRSGDDTQVMAGATGPRDLGRADDRRAVGDRGLAQEPEPDDAHDVGVGQYDSAAPEIVAFRPRPEPAAYYADSPEPLAPESAEPAGSPRLAGPAGPQAGADPTRPGRILRGASLARLRRPGSPASEHTQEDGEPQPQDGRDRVGSTAASDAAAWNASELPGQAAVTDTAV